MVISLKLLRYPRTSVAHKVFPHIRHLVNLSSQTTPNFTSYLYYLTLPGHIKDIHWEGYVETCNPCSVQYSAIGHLETAERDTEFILNNSGLHRFINQSEVKRTHPAPPPRHEKRRVFG